MSQNPGVRDFAVQGYEGMQNLTHTVQTDYIMPNYNKALNYTTNKFGNLWSTEHSGLNFSTEGMPILYDNSTQYINVTMPHSESFGTSYYPHQSSQGLDFLTNPVGKETPQSGKSYWNQFQEYGNKTYNYLMGKTGKQPHTSSAPQSGPIANVSAQNETATHSFSSNIPATKDLSLTNTQGKEVAISNPPTCPADYKTNAATTTNAPSPTNTQASPFTTSNPTCPAGYETSTTATTKTPNQTNSKGSPSVTSKPTSIAANKSSLAKKPEVSHSTCDKDEFFDAPEYQTP